MAVLNPLVNGTISPSQTSSSGSSSVQEEQLYTWASVGLPVSSQLWELYGGQLTGREQSFRSMLHPSLSKTQKSQNSQVGNVLVLFLL